VGEKARMESNSTSGASTQKIKDDRRCWKGIIVDGISNAERKIDLPRGSSKENLTSS